jgi:hypothetical protein
MAWSNGYAYKCLFTFNVRPASSLTNFPNLILGTYPALKTTANGGFVTHTVTLNGQTVPADLIFTSDAAGSTLLSWEIESYDATTGAIVAWVKSTRSSSADTLIYAWAGNSSVSTYQCTATATWDCLAAWHLANGSTLSAIDSTSNANNGTNVGATATAGQIGGGAAFDGSSHYIHAPNIGSLAGASALTMSAWMYISASTTMMCVGQSNNTNTGLVGLYHYNDGSINFELSATGGVYSGGTLSYSVVGWHHIVGVFDGSQTGNSNRLKIYIDGVLQTISFFGTVPATVPSNAGTFDLGRYQDNGAGYEYSNSSLDEPRLYLGVRSADWIAHEYAQQSQASAWYTAGPWAITPRCWISVIG